MFNVEEVLETPWDNPTENAADESLEISTVITPEQVAATEVLNPLVNSNPSFSPSNDSEISCDVNLESRLLDSGASCCVTHDCSQMLDTRPSNKVIVVGNGFKVPTVLQGTIQIQDPTGCVLDIDDVHYAPSFTKNIISMRVLLENGWRVTNATPTKVSLTNNTQTVISFDLDSSDKLYYFHGYRNIRDSKFAAISQTKAIDINAFHGIFAHADFTTCKLMAHSMKVNLTGTKMHCGACALAKSKAKAVPKTAATKSSKPGKRLFLDISGPYLGSVGGSKY